MNFIFLTYVNRSGSTFLANLLDSSPEILACPEGDALISYFLENPGGTFKLDDKTGKRLINIFSSDTKLQNWGDGKLFVQGLENAKNNLEAFITILINYRNNVKPDAEFILFKGERIVHLISKILRIKNNHKTYFIAIIRDPRGVYASQKRTFFPETKKLMSTNPVRTSLLWKEHVKRVLINDNQDNLFVLRYEDLVMNIDDNIKDISRLLNLGLSGITPGQGALVKRLPHNHKSIHLNCDKPPDQKKVQEWENMLSKSEILKIEFVTNKLLIKLNYKKKQKGFQYLIIVSTVIYQTIGFYLRKVIQKILFRLRIIGDISHVTA